MAALVIACLITLVIGFCIGVALVRAKQRWCPTCGVTMTCPDCAARAAQEVSGGAPRTRK